MSNQKIHEKVMLLQSEIQKNIIGQHTLVRDILLTLFSGGHILIEGVPGLAKTLAVSTLAQTISADFQRIQFTPDLLPSDLIGSQIYNPKTQEFGVKKGPIFSNFVLADEINRANSKLQSALLESMQESQVTIAEKSYKLPKVFMVLATQNPVEQDGTYPLSEAQADRFLLKTLVDYPSQDEELEIMKQFSLKGEEKIKKILKASEILELREVVKSVFVEENIFEYIKDIVFYSREKNSVSKYLEYGLSPRASIALVKVAKTQAFLEGRDFVLPEDVQTVAPSVLRHRIILNYEALGDEVDEEMVVGEILKRVEIK